MIPAAGFGSNAAHAGSTEGLAAHGGSRDAAVEVQVPDAEFSTCLREVGRLSAVHASSEAVPAIVCQFQRVLEVPRAKRSFFLHLLAREFEFAPNPGPLKAEDLFLHELGFGIVGYKDVRGNVRPPWHQPFLRKFHAKNQLVFLLGSFDALADHRGGVFIDHRANIRAGGITRAAGHQ